MTRRILKAFLWLGVVAFPPTGWGYEVVTDEHTDVLSIRYSAAAGLGAVSTTDSTTHAAGEALFYDGPTGSTSLSRPSGSQWDFLGVNAGDPIYVWPQNSVPGRIYAGIEAESIATGTFANVLTGDPRATAAARWLTVQLKDVRFFDLNGDAGNAEFSLWQSPALGAGPKVWMTTDDGGITSEDLFFITENGHAHVNWGFSKAGYYQIDFEVSGVLADTMQTISSPVMTFHFGVEHQPMAIPEPSVIGLIALALIGGLAARRSFSITSQKQQNE